MCMTHTAASESRATCNMHGSPESPVTSLMISTPASRALLATAAFEVSIDMGIEQPWRKRRDHWNDPCQFSCRHRHASE